MLKRRLFLASIAFFLLGAFFVNVKGLSDLGTDDKTIYLAASSCIYNKSRFQQVLERRQEILTQCRGDARCEIRTSERLACIYNYPVLSSSIAFWRLFYDKNIEPICSRLGASIYLGYMLQSCIIYLLLFLAMAIYASPLSQKKYASLLVLLIIFHPYINSLLVDIKKIGLPFIEAIDYPVGVHSRNYIGLIFLTSLFFIYEKKFWMVLVLSVLSSLVHIGQSVPINALLSVVMVSWALLQGEARRFIPLLGPGIVAMVSLALFKINYVAKTPIATNVLDLLQVFTLVNVESLVFLVLGILFLWLMIKYKWERFSIFFALSAYLVLFSITILSAYTQFLGADLPTQQLTTVQIIDQRFAGNTLVVVVYAAFLLMLDGLSILVKNKMTSGRLFAHSILCLVFIFLYLTNYLKLNIFSGVQGIGLKMTNELCVKPIPSSRVDFWNALKEGQVLPRDEVDFNLNLFQHCRQE